MTQLADLIRAQIKTTGPLTLAQYMTTCLLHPEHGYYTRQIAIGAKGDFTTAPEISQMFGELIGLSLAQSWLDQGAPAPCTLAELGPGRGTLMSDLLRATANVPGFHDALELHLIEASPAMRDAQAIALPDHTPVWHDSADSLPEDQALFVVANEFFDALPIRQFQRSGDGWAEVMIGLDANGMLQLGLSQSAPVAFLSHRLDDTEDGDVVEYCAPAQPVIAAISERIAQKGGAALIIDYGDWRSRGDTFQAVRDHEPTDPLGAPGEADLTGHVDFEALAQPATRVGCAHSRLTTQGVFLERLGITQRAQNLARTLSGPALESHIAAHRRLTHPEEMGTLFKVLSLHPTDSSVPPGLDP